MRIISPSNDSTNPSQTNIFERILLHAIGTHNRNDVIHEAVERIRTYDKNNFYPLVKEVLDQLGFNCSITRIGDTNNRMDAIIIDNAYSIPIEIKSPTESGAINIKSIRQAIENKVVLLSRKFYPTTYETTSLAIGYNLPAKRSDVTELIENIYRTYDINIGIIDISTILNYLWDKYYHDITFDKSKIIFLQGRLEYENI